ncbi:MAG: glycosyltransferase [Phycisphaerae bacterium]|jgi:UDP-N-acetylglucosamine:LPS N-acetylglucosamine transferase
MSRPCAIFAGGGTGGHIFPGVAIAEQLQPLAPGCDLHFVCSERPGDGTMLQASGRPFTSIPAQPFGLRPRTLLRFLGSWGASVRAVRSIIASKRSNGPVVMVAMGGFVAAPAAQAARAEGVPIVLVNLDAVPGRANRWIARHAQRVLTAAKVPGINWEYARPIIRRSAMAPGDREACRRLLHLDPARTTMLVTGASLGARTINDFLGAWVDRHGALLRGWQVIHQTGQGEHAALRQVYERAGVPAVVVPFLESMGAAWGAADVAVSRSGAGSVAEAWANRVPTLFLPYPHHKDEHQRLNALPLQELGAAVIERDLVDPAANLAAAGETLATLIRDPERRHAMAQRLSEHGPPEGARVVAHAVARLWGVPERDVS